MEPIELTIRCAMQTFEDRTVSCPPEWTVLELKKHLHTLYSSKPNVDRQRLIYSGRCLENGQQLRSFLRLDVGAGPHVIHMVCPSPHAAGNTGENELRRRVTSGSSSTFPPSSSVSALSPNESANAPSTLAYQPADTTGHTFAGNEPSAYEAYAASYQNYVNQLLHQQHLYYQQYPQALPPLAFQPFLLQGPAVANPLPHQGMYIGAAPYLIAPNAQADNNAMNAANAALDGAVPANEPQPDVLDLVYTAIRFALLAIILYLYSSVERFTFVVAVAMFVWFVQRQRRRNRAEVAAVRLRPGPPAAFQQNDAHPQETDGEGGHQPTPVATVSAWNVFWSTVFSFFASLIPETPAPINVN